MNVRSVSCLAAFVIAGCGLAGPTPAQDRGHLKLPEFAGLAEEASESVTVSLDSQLLGLGCRFLDAGDPGQADAKQLCTALRGIYVRKFTFESDYAMPKPEIDRVRRQLSGPGWSRLVEARSKKENSQVDVYMLVEGDKAQGLAIIASEPREFVIVNIVGSIDLEKLHQLEGKFGVPELEIEEGGKSPAKGPAPKK